MDDTDLRLDGNAAAGQLAGVFAFDITIAEATCSGCGAVQPVGRLIDYGGAMGTVLRCPDCDTALIRLSRAENRLWLDLRGTRILRVSTGR